VDFTFIRRGEASGVTSKRVLIIGSPYFTDWDQIKSTVMRHEPTLIIHGHGLGVDLMASMYAQIHLIDEMRFPPQWQLHGDAAPQIRDSRMVELGKPDVLLAFPEHNQDALLRALRRAGVQVIEIDSQDVANLLPRKS
jgi:hypothetical protein